MSGLTALVSAAIDLGGPNGGSVEPEHLQRLLHGMPDSGGNAYGFSAPATDVDIIQAGGVLSRREILEQDGNAPMLVINCADDVHAGLESHPGR